jgi:hypothetical protein
MIIILALNLASFANVFPMFAMLLSILLGYYFSLKTSIFSFVLFILVIMSSICFYFW